MYQLIDGIPVWGAHDEATLAQIRRCASDAPVAAASRRCSTPTPAPSASCIPCARLASQWPGRKFLILIKIESEDK